MNKFIVSVSFLFLQTLSMLMFAQSAGKITSDTSIASEEELIIEQLDKIMTLWYARQASYQENSQLPFCLEDIESENIDSIHCHRLKSITDQTLFPMVYNEQVKRYIELYTKRHKSMSLLLSLSQHYFPLFEETLDKYDCPLELKYLAVIESALNPNAVSRAGATGLWQFMYNTGKMYDLEVTTWVDDRRDPLKSTDAAARHLRDLSKMFNDDWVLAIAAYNCGPGNVTKAMRRSGGKTNFWDIYEHLPRETRGYVPAFYGAMYAMKYYDKYGISPRDTVSLQIDTLHISKELHFQQLADMLNIPIEVVKTYNPRYKRDVVPAFNETMILTLPVEYILAFEDVRDTVFKHNYDLHFSQERIAYTNTATDGIKKIHVVKNGESLSVIARKYGISVNQISQWNNKKSTMIHPGDKLVVGFVKPPQKVKPQNIVQIQQDTIKKEDKKEVENNASEETILGNNENQIYKTYTISEGDTLLKISQQFESVSIEDIKKINNITDDKPLEVGTVLQIPVNN